MAGVHEKVANTDFAWVRVSPVKNCLFYASWLLSAGIVPIVCTNYPNFRMQFITDKCGADDAEFMECNETDLVS